MNIIELKERLAEIENKLAVGRKSFVQLNAEINALEGARVECLLWINKITPKDGIPDAEKLREIVGDSNANVINLETVKAE